jgi:hypothetical protein
MLPLLRFISYLCVVAFPHTALPCIREERTRQSRQRTQVNIYLPVHTEKGAACVGPARSAGESGGCKRRTHFLWDQA